MRIKKLKPKHYLLFVLGFLLVTVGITLVYWLMAYTGYIKVRNNLDHLEGRSLTWEEIYQIWQNVFLFGILILVFAFAFFKFADKKGRK